MAKRMVVTLSATFLIVAALGFVKFKQIQTAIAEGAAFQLPPEAVTTIVARAERWPDTLNAIGTVAAVQGVNVSADLPGTVVSIGFSSGQAIREGDVLARQDTRQEQAQLAAVESQRELARLNFERMQGLLNERVISRAEFDRATADQRQADARVGEIRAAIDRKTIRAPFAGILGLRQVNLGQYLAGGDPLVTLQSLNPIYVNFGVPQQATGQMQVGRAVRVTAEELAGTDFTGRITAIDSIVNEATRNMQVQATFANPHGRLHPGMFVQSEVGTRCGERGADGSGVRHQLRAVRRFGIRRRRVEKREGTNLSRRAAAIRQAGKRAWRPGWHRVGNQSGRGSGHLGRVQAAEWRRRAD